MTALLFYMHDDGTLTQQRVWWYGPEHARRWLPLGRKMFVEKVGAR